MATTRERRQSLAALGVTRLHRLLRDPNRHLDAQMHVCVHAVMLDGVYGPHPDSGQPTFVAVPPPSVQGRRALGPHAGQRLRRRLTDPASGQRTAPLCFAARGFSLHAATPVAAADREGLERLARYVNRPPPQLELGAGY